MGGRAALQDLGKSVHLSSFLENRPFHSHISSLLNTMKKGCGCLKPYMVTIETEWPWSISMNTSCIPAQLCFCNLPVLLHYDAGSHRVHTTQIGLTTNDNMEVWTLWTIFFNSVKWSTTYDICTLAKLHNELLVQSIPCATLVNQSKHYPDHVFERKCLVFNLWPSDYSLSSVGWLRWNLRCLIKS